MHEIMIMDGENVKVKVKSCTKGQWYKNDIGKVFEIKNYCDVTEVYWIKGSEFGIPSADAEVVEDVNKSCTTCHYNENNSENETACYAVVGNCSAFEKWKLIETVKDVVKSCDNCERSYIVCGGLDCDFYKECSDLKLWKLKKLTAEKFVKLEFEKDFPLMAVRSCDTCGYVKPCDRCLNLNLTEWIPCEPMESCCGQAEPPKPFTREDLTKEINQSCDDIKKLFSYKNQDYGMVEDAFANFRKTAERIIVPFMDRHGVQIDIKDAMYLVLSIYVDKHAVALSQTGLRGNEVAERLGDIANYSLIAKAMLKGG